MIYPDLGDPALNAVPDEASLNPAHHDGLVRLGRLVEARRLAMGLSQFELAQKIGTDRKIVIRVENGRGVRVSTLAALLDVLGLQLTAGGKGMSEIEQWQSIRPGWDIAEVEKALDDGDAAHQMLGTAERLLRDLGIRNDTMLGFAGPRKRHIDNCWCRFPIEDWIDGQRNQVAHEPRCLEIRGFLGVPKT